MTVWNQTYLSCIGTDFYCYVTLVDGVLYHHVIISLVTSKHLATSAAIPYRMQDCNVLPAFYCDICVPFLVCCWWLCSLSAPILCVLEHRCWTGAFLLSSAGRLDCGKLVLYFSISTLHCIYTHKLVVATCNGTSTLNLAKELFLPLRLSCVFIAYNMTSREMSSLQSTVNN